MPMKNDAINSNKEKYVEEKARSAWNICNDKRGGIWAFCLVKRNIEDFIRTIMSEVRRLTSDKPKVSKAFIEEESYRLEWTDKDELRREDKLPTTLRNAGVEVENK